MNYILSCTRQYNGEFQSIVVKMRGVSGERFTTMRSWALRIAQFDFTGITGNQFKSENFVSNESLKNVNASSFYADVNAIVKWKKGDAVDNDLPRNIIVRLNNTSYNNVVSDFKAKFEEITGTAYDSDNKLVITNFVVDLKPIV